MVSRPGTYAQLLRSVAMLCAVTGMGACLCGNTLIEKIPSPGGRLQAIVFNRDCGATTDFVTHVSVISTGGGYGDAGNIFIADANHNKAPRDARGGPLLTIRWIDAHNLEI